MFLAFVWWFSTLILCSLERKHWKKQLLNRVQHSPERLLFITIISFDSKFKMFLPVFTMIPTPLFSKACRYTSIQLINFSISSSTGLLKFLAQYIKNYESGKDFIQKMVYALLSSYFTLFNKSSNENYIFLTDKNYPEKFTLIS